MISLARMSRILQEELVRLRSKTFLSSSSTSSLANRNFSTDSTDLEEENDAYDSDAEAEEEERARVEKLRNVSGLPPKQYKLYHGIVDEPPFKDLQRRRKMYSLYGSKSGEDPRLLWPSKQEINKMQQDDRLDDIPLLEKIRIANQEKDETLKAKIERKKMIEKNMDQMDEWISEYHKKTKQENIALEQIKEKKQALLDEARDYFGYRVKESDPKFEKMVEEKEEKEKLEKKAQKKKEKARKLAERLRQDVEAMKLSSTESGSAVDKS